MSGWFQRLVMVMVMVMLAAALPGAASAGPPPGRGFVALITLDGPIGPASAEYFHDASERAKTDGATAIVLQIDTPGGLLTSMRAIIADMLASPVPVIVYVAPGGARAASAGTYILYAGQLAAMAPGTHLGAATPVSLGGGTTMPPADTRRKPASSGTAPAAARSSAASASQTDGARDAESTKVLNDSVAYIRSLAQLRGRNAAWAERAVRRAATLTADEAASQGVIDFVAPSVSTLLAKAKGRTVQVDGRDVILHLQGAPVRIYAPSARQRFLGAITHPTIAYLLLLVGIVGLLLEGFHPGAILPGVVGGICLLVGLYALQLLPVSYVGLALMALGVGLLVSEAFTPSYGALGVGGIVSFVLGSVMLMQTGVPGYSINLGIIAAVAVAAVALLVLLLWAVFRARDARLSSGDELLLDAPAELLEPVSAGGTSWARVYGERWKVRCDTALPAHAPLRVLRRQGLLLWVAPLSGEAIDTRKRSISSGQPSGSA